MEDTPVKISVPGATMFASDVITPDSWGSAVGLCPLDSIGAVELTGQYTGIKALMLAVLDEAIRSYLGEDERTHSDAAYWIACGGRQSPFAFVVVCETLGLDPGAVRAAVHRMRAANMSSREAVGRCRANVRRPGNLITRKAS